MAAISASIDKRRGFWVISWTTTDETDTFVAEEVGWLTDKSVQFSGTWNGATFTLQGSNDAATYIVLTDPQGNGISKTVDAVEQITEATRYIKPTQSGGGASTAITVSVMCVKPTGAK